VADVLIVDDDTDSAEVLAQILRDEGHHVRIAHDGREGLELLRQAIPQIALLDVEMPFLDGRGMAHEMLLRDTGLERVPVVFLSASRELRRVARELGTPYFLAKPYGAAQVLALVSRALTERIAPHVKIR
jgi:CheY-like chemotaxis protein